MSEVANLYNVGSSPTLAFKIGITKGAYRQLVDRLLCMQEAAGSSPAVSILIHRMKYLIQKDKRNRRSERYGESVPGLCTHRPSHSGSWS